jgi:hypothetical protein
MTGECPAKRTVKYSIGLNRNEIYQPDSSFQHINPACNFYLTENQFYPLTINFCEAFHRSDFPGLKIIRFLLPFSPPAAFVTD